MAKFKVVKDCNNKKDGESFKANQVVDKTVRYVEDFESRLEKAGYELPFFTRLDKK